jgi:uncharacterized SAM-dependent methyltransferase
VLRIMNDEFLPIALHASEHPRRQREALLESLRALRLPGKLLYQSPGQAQRWLDYHAAWSPSRTDAALQRLYGQAFSAAAAGLEAGACLLVGLGSGGGSKDADLLERLAKGRKGAPLHYAPLDASPALVCEAALQARRRRPEVALHPLVANVADAPVLEAWLEHAAPGAVRVYSCLGMLPNLDVRAFPAWLAGLLRPRDALLVSANLAPQHLGSDGARILLQYDNPPARAWYRGALSELGIPPAAYALDVSARPLAEAEALGLSGETAWQVAVRAALREDVQITLYGEELRFPAGRRLEVFHSHRFTVAAAERVLQAAGLHVSQRWVGAAGEEGIFLCGRD